jgi:hypothetical protein
LYLLIANLAAGLALQSGSMLQVVTWSGARVVRSHDIQPEFARLRGTEITRINVSLSVKCSPRTVSNAHCRLALPSVYSSCPPQALRVAFMSSL